MGSGKTTVSRLLAERLGLRQIEMDDLVLERSGAKSIPEIFDRHGEPHFRSLEEAVATALETVDNAVISTGGGVVTKPETMRALQRGARAVVFLSASFEELRGRVRDDTSRPLFRDPEKARTLYEARLPLYQAAAEFEVRTDGRLPEQIADEICARVEQKE